MDLFRILMMMFVLTLHYPVNIGPEAIQASLPAFIVFLLRHFTVIAVNGFILMSGYFLSKSKITIAKVINITLWLSLYWSGLYITFSLLGFGPSFSVSTAIKSVFPIFFGGWWFMFPYIVLLSIAPFLNRLIEHLSQKQYLVMLLLIFLIEVAWPSIISSSAIDKQAGYSLYNFLFLYLVGAHFRKYTYTINKWHIFVGLVIIVLGATAVHFALIHFEFNPHDITNRFMNYNFISVSMAAILFFMLFTQIKIKPNKYLALLRPHVLAVYLIHTHSSVEHFLYNELFNVSNYNTGMTLIPHLIFFTISTFILCVLVDIVLQLVFKKPIRFISMQTDTYLMKNLNYVTSFISQKQ